MKNFFAYAASIAVVSSALTASMPARAAEDFQLHNDSDFVIVSFQAFVNGGWSNNWINRANRIPPGGFASMDSGGYRGPCNNIRFRVISDDKFVHDYNGNFCKISNIYIHNKDATWD